MGTSNKSLVNRWHGAKRRPGWFTSGPVDYEVTRKGEPFGCHNVSVSSIADIVKKVVDDDTLYSRDSIGVNTPRS